MKKLLLLSTIFLSIISSGQDMNDIRFGVIFGPTITSVNYRLDAQRQSSTPKIGAVAGIQWRIPWEKNLYFAPEIFYSTKAYKVKFDHPSTLPSSALDNDFRIHSIEINPMLQYNVGNLFLKAGFAFDFHMFGTEHYHDKTGQLYTRNVPLDMNWNYGLVGASLPFELGYQLNDRMTIAFKYDHGIANVSNVDGYAGGPKIFHDAFGIQIGKFF